MSTSANYILLDAARMDDAIDKAHELNKTGKTLYSAKNQNTLLNVSPYLFNYESETEFSKWHAVNGWGNSWGVYILCFSDFESLHKHFRKFIIIKTEDGEEMYFRFYDPRVLRVFLPTCDVDQLKEFFGPVKAYLMEDEDSEFGLIFTLNESNILVTQQISKDEFEKALSLGLESIKKEQVVIKEKPTSTENKKDKPSGNKGRFSIID